jgi:hypothetical protein
MKAFPLILSNKSIVTADSNYTLETIPLLEALSLVINAKNGSYKNNLLGIDSVVDNESIANAMSELLGIQVSVSYKQFEQKPGQLALIFKLRRCSPEDKILTREEIEEGGYEFKLMRID